ncbi:mitochondrial protein Pet127-domain-containing protein [Aspergillus cavernicola]|uniref:Mitochondrial protein Pet127-domain-containing protein n=1 Tax=Aspergillus cavernicola TaxID=176166 RepID=A0ABR4IKH9_9EURO
MFRASLRSVSDPVLREHVCFSCLARGRAQARFFYSTPASHEDSGNKDSQGAVEESSDLVQSLRETLKHQSQRFDKRRPADKDKKPADKDGKPDENGGKPDDKDKKPNLPTKRGQPKEQKRAGTRKATAEGSPVTSGIQFSLQELVKKLEKKGEKKFDVAYYEAQGFPQPPRMVAGSIKSRYRAKVHSKRQIMKRVDVEGQPVPQLSFGLERVLFNPGVYHLRDPRSRVFNFDPYLGSIMPVTEFDFTALKEYITSSRDDTLRNIAIKNGRKYVGSSSSMTSVLSHFHFLLSAWRPIDASMVSQGFSDHLRTFTRLMRAPAAMFLRYQDGVYAIDADKEFDSANILMNLGKSMEKLLTLPKEEFERYRRSHENKITAEEEALTPESYHYSMLGDFMMRSQLDAYNPNLPGTGMFDLKTRAVVSIRMDARRFEEGLGYQIKSRFGNFESYEREYYDMIRSAFLKYSLQVRIGRMDGIFVAFHNIERIFGFQYVSLPEMDQTLHGQSDTVLGDTEFRLSLALWNTVLNKATAKYPKQSLRFHFETRETNIPYMYIFYEPVTDDQIHNIQNKNKAVIDAYQRRVLNLDHEDEPDTSPPPSTKSDNKSTQEPSSEDVSSTDSQPEDPSTDTSENTTPEASTRKLSAMTLTIINLQNGKRVERVTDLGPRDSWNIDYELTDLEGPQIERLYDACVRRRAVRLNAAGEDVDDVPPTEYLRKLKALSKEGRSYRKQQDKYDENHGVTVLNGVKL